MSAREPLTRSDALPRATTLRAVVLLLAWVGFYLLGLGLSLALLWVPWAQATYGTPDLGGILAGIGGLWVLWGLRPRFGPKPTREPPLPLERHPKLRELITDVARRAGHPVPSEIHLVPEANAFAAYRRAWLGRGESVVGIGLPYLVWLDRPAVEAIIAHELGHHLAGDVRLGPWVHRTRSLMGSALDHLEGSSFWLDLPFVAYARAFLRYSLSVSRAQEVAADAVSSQIAGAEAAARALVVTHERSTAWQVYIRSEVIPMLEAGYLPELLAGFEHFEAGVRGRRAENEPAKPEERSDYDTHPTLEERLALLGIERPAQVDAAGGRELLDDLRRAEEDMVRSFLVDATRPLKALAWSDAGALVWLPRFRERIAPFERELRTLSARELPAAVAQSGLWAERLRSGLSVLSPAAERKRVLALLGTWYAVSLVDAGCALEALPGWPVFARAGELSVEPFHALSSLGDRSLTASAFLAQDAALRQALASLTPPAEPAPGAP